jgi:gas vesicle protein
MYCYSDIGVNDLSWKEIHAMDDNKGLPYFFLGLGLGVAVGMIFAPVSGTEARGAIKNRAREGGDYLRRRGEDLRESASDVVERGRGLVNRQREQFTAAVDAGRQAYREAISSNEPSSAGQGPQGSEAL